MLNLENGYELIEGFLDSSQLLSITSELETVSLPAKVGGIRNAEKKFNSINRLAQSELLAMKAQEYLCGTPKFVRAILFNKTFNNNWLVTWHQDRTVAVSTKFERDGWGPWSIKDSTHHVQPPIEVLNYMITLRIHLDDTDEKNGCLKLIPKSHMFGILPQDKISEYTKKHEQVSCIGKRGSALVMRPHILHSSSKAINSAQRRVLHVEFSSYKLPEGVAWA